MVWRKIFVLKSYSTAFWEYSTNIQIKSIFAWLLQLLFDQIIIQSIKLTIDQYYFMIEIRLHIVVKWFCNAWYFLVSNVINFADVKITEFIKITLISSIMMWGWKWFHLFFITKTWAILEAPQNSFLTKTKQETSGAYNVLEWNLKKLFIKS